MFSGGGADSPEGGYRRGVFPLMLSRCSGINVGTSLVPKVPEHLDEYLTLEVAWSQSAISLIYLARYGIAPISAVVL